MPHERTVPTQERLDALFAKTQSARLRYPIGVARSAPKQPTVIKVAQDRLAQLHAALQLHDDGVPIGCHCAGTVGVELIGSSPPNAMLTLHLHRHMFSLWITGDASGARLRGGDEILNRLAEWGITAPLEIIEEALRSQTVRASLLPELKSRPATPPAPAPMPPPRRRRKR